MEVTWLPPEIYAQLEEVQRSHGSDSLVRVWEFLRLTAGDRIKRDALQYGAQHVFPGLPQKGWHEVDEFEELGRGIRALEERIEDIRGEYRDYLDSGGRWVPYRSRTAIRGWQSVYLFSNGAPNEDMRAEFPRTIAHISDCMGSHLYTLAEVNYSILEPESEIPRHCDDVNFTLNLHVGIDIPKGCWIRVGREVRYWQQDRSLLFDTTFEHEAHNPTREPRVVLLMDVWHPMLTAPERAALTLVFNWLFQQVSR